MANLAQLKFFVTPAHPCSYLADRDATTLFVDPAAPMDNELYSSLSALGFRRSGRHVYRPHCERCSACIPVRIPVHRFAMGRRQRRVWNRNGDLEVRIVEATLTDEAYQLYARYIAARHHDGDMYPPSPNQFRSFLLSEWSATRSIQFYARERLVAVAVVDVIRDGLSAIYTFFDPDESKRSLGVYAILWQIHYAASKGYEHVYLGYWIKQCQKMSYKSDYRPLEMYMGEQWIAVD